MSPKTTMFAMTRAEVTGAWGNRRRRFIVAEFFTGEGRLSSSASPMPNRPGPEASRVLDSSSKQVQGHPMQPQRPPRSTLRRLTSAGRILLLGAGLGGAGFFFHGTTRGPALIGPAAAANTAVTPKTEVPSEAKVLSRAFSAV